MELVYCEDGVPWASPKLKLREHFSNYSKLLAEIFIGDEVTWATMETREQKIAHMMDIDEETCKSLSEKCRYE